MTKSLNQSISDSRLLLGNPYAYLDDLGNFSALPRPRQVPVNEASVHEIKASRQKLENPYAHLNGSDGFSATSKTTNVLLRGTMPVRGHALRGLYAHLRSTRGNKKYSTNSIATKAASLHQLIWSHKDELWPEGQPQDPVDMLDPSIAFQLIGYDFEIADGLGQYFVEGKQVEVAGFIDSSTMTARVSRRFPSEVQNFTAAHELGHALLHDARGLHRDRPLDGSSPTSDPIETEANKFASVFLMPEKTVEQRFSSLFGSGCFVLNEDTRFALSRGGISLDKCRTKRELARILANATNYNGTRFQSLAVQFRVSGGAMAIRLEELELIAM